VDLENDLLDLNNDLMELKNYLLELKMKRLGGMSRTALKSAAVDTIHLRACGGDTLTGLKNDPSDRISFPSGHALSQEKQSTS
jgi:hypothetical protein